MIVESSEIDFQGLIAVDESHIACEDCGRSMMTRFGRGLLPARCPSCNDEFNRLSKAGKLWITWKED